MGSETENIFDWFIEVAILLLSARLLEGVVERLGQPKVFAWVLIGITLPFLNYELSVVTSSLGILGIISYLFYVGLEGSLKGFLKGLRDAGLIAAGGVAASLMLPILILMEMGLGFKEAFSIGVALSATSVTLTIKTLEELGKVHGREGQTILGAAVVDDVLGLSLLSALIGLSEGGSLQIMLSITEIVGLAFAFWFAVAFTFQKMARPLYRYFSRLSDEAPTLTLTFAILLILSYVAVELRLSSILLAYALGLGLSSHRYIARRVESMMHPIIVLFTPLFFIGAGSLFNVHELFGVDLGESLTIIFVIIVLGYLTKLIGCYVPARILGFSNKESLIIGIGMVPRAEVMMTVALAARDAGMLSSASYLALILMLPITSLTIPPLIARLYGK